MRGEKKPNRKGTRKNELVVKKERRNNMKEKTKGERKRE